jgi:hypothetical protein
VFLVQAAMHNIYCYYLLAVDMLVNSLLLNADHVIFKSVSFNMLGHVAGTGRPFTFPYVCGWC